MDAVRGDELRQGAARPVCARLPRRGAGTLPRRRGRSANLIDALALAERALAAASGDGAEALVHAERSALARFASSDVHQPTLIENAHVELRVVRDGRSGWAASNRLSPDGLTELARRAEAAADSATSDPDYPGLAPPEPLPEVEGDDEETAALEPDEQARFARRAMEAAGAEDAYGYFTSGVTTVALASTTGVAADQRMTDATTLVLAGGDGWSGYADATSWRVADLDPGAVGRAAAEIGARTRGAREVEPGTYRALLGPNAVAELLAYFAFDSLTGLGLIEGRSHLAGRLGEKLFDEKLTVVDDALDPAGLPKRFDFEGSPKRRVTLVDAGVARGVVWDRTTAARAGDGQETTGHAGPPEYRTWGPLPLSLAVEPGDVSSREGLAELVGDGVSVTRLHYLSVVDPREGIVTGMTRDGTFRIRDGRPAEPLVNVRFTTSVPRLLAELLGITRERKRVNQSDFYGDRYPIAFVCPAIATGAFTVTGIGSSPGL